MAQELGFLQPTWTTLNDFQASDFGLAQPWVLQAFVKLISKQKISPCLSVSLYFQIK